MILADVGFGEFLEAVQKNGVWAVAIWILVEVAQWFEGRPERLDRKAIREAFERELQQIPMELKLMAGEIKGLSLLIRPLSEDWKCIPETRDLAEKVLNRLSKQDEHKNSDN